MTSYSSTPQPFRVFVTIVVCFVSSVISQPALYRQDCVVGGNYTAGSIYQSNLNSLFTTINSNTQLDYGFYNISSGVSPDTANVIALCRGDINRADCSRCLNDSTHELPRVCPNQKEAVGWYDRCMLRYSDSSTIFGRRAPEPKLWECNSYLPTNATQFNDVLAELMYNLSDTASSLGDSRRKFAAGEGRLSNFERIYAFVQCTPDLNRLYCSNCIKELIGMIQQHCMNKNGGRMIDPSCNIRYETFEVVEPAPPPPPPTQPRPPGGTPDGTKGAKSQNSLRTIKIVAVISAVANVFLLIALIFICLRSKRPRKYIRAMGDVITMESFQYNFSTINIATDGFSDANKLGEGGFGSVYKGTLFDGQEVAVKRLSTGSGQGGNEFKTEVMLVARLQHRDLVRLLGFCLEGDERLLIYEFLPNKSLDTFLFDRAKRSELDWGTRYNIIGGIANGLLYLHEYSRLRIVHRDLKASNILLDADMNPKIADFGLARLFEVDQTQASTNKIIGTHGYMSPEYAMHGRFSVKSDVYSFGVLVLEIVSGSKNTWCQNNRQSENLINYAWQNWTNGTLSNLIDPTLKGGSNSELMRCIHIGLLSVQENVSDRPTMASIVMMLSSNFATLPVPSQPSSGFMPISVENDSSGSSDKSQKVNDARCFVSTNDPSFTQTCIHRQ